MARLEEITRAGYKVKVQWECEFDDAGVEAPELLAYPTVCQSPLCTRDALCVVRTEAMRLHFKPRESETIQYVDVISLSVHMQVFQVPVDHPFIHVGDACKKQGSLLGLEWFYKMFNRSSREVLSSRAPFPNQSETHVLSVSKMLPNLEYRRMFPYDSQ